MMMGVTDISKKWQIAAGIAAIFLLTLLVYSPVFSAGFIWDDNDHVIRIARLTGFDGLRRIWTEFGATMEYWPLLFTTFWAQIHLWGLNPFPFHLVNIVFHTCNALLLWLCLSRLGIRRGFWAACIFAVHPIHVESVAWVTELKNPLSGFFYFLSFLAYWRFFEAESVGTIRLQSRWYWYGGAFFLFACALLSKTSTCMLPPAILLLIWWKRGSLQWRDVVLQVPFFVLAVILGKITISNETDFLLSRGPEWDFSFIERILIAGRSTWFHVWKMIWPYPLMFNYPRWHLDAAAWWQHLFPLTALALPVLLWHYRNRIGRGPLAACLFIMGTNFPVLGFFNIYSFRFSFVADHYYYLSNVGVIVLCCAAIGYLCRKWLPDVVSAETICFGVIIGALSLLTWQQGKIYRSNMDLFSDTIRKNPLSWFSYSTRAVEYSQAGRDDLAMADLEESIRIKPDEADAIHTRGTIFLKQRNIERAFADFDRSITIRPWRVDYIKNRCVAYRFAGRLDEALQDADRVIAMEPSDAQHYLLRASILALREEYDRALADLNQALRIDPDEFQAYANRGLIYYRQGLLPRAISDYDTALRLRPESAETYLNRGLAFARSGDRDRAVADLQQARRAGYQLTDAELQKLLEGRPNR